MNNSCCGIWDADIEDLLYFVWSFWYLGIPNWDVVFCFHRIQCIHILVLYTANLGLGFPPNSILCSDYSDVDTQDNNSSNVTKALLHKLKKTLTFGCF